MRIANKIKRYHVRLLLGVSAISLLLVLSGCSSSSNESPVQTTVLLYIEGTNLEDDDNEATGNIKEILAASSSENIRIVLETGAASVENPADPVKSWKTVKRHKIENGRIIELQDLGEKDMGDPDVLRDFIVWGQRKFPADRYMLVFWDHGGGSVYGYGGYEIHDPPETIATTMYIPAIKKGIGDAIAVTGRMFELIGFDACLMATVETAYSLSGYAKYYAASQELEPGGGWDYTALFNFLAVNPSSGGLSVGKVIADSYADKCIRSKSGDGYTFSITDLSEVKNIADELNELGSIAAGEIAEEGADAWNELGVARMFTEEFGAMYASNRFFNMADIIGFAEKLGQVDQGTYGNICNRVINAVEKAVKYNIKGDAHEDAAGLSAYMPYHVFTKAKTELTNYNDLPFASEYKDMINHFVNYPLDNPPGPKLAFSEAVRTGDTLYTTVSSPFGMSEVFIDVTVGPVDGKYIKKSQDLVRLEDDDDDILYTLTYRWFTLDGMPVIGYFEKGQGFWDDYDSYDIAIPVYHRRSGTPASKNVKITILIDYQRLLNYGEVDMACESSSLDDLSSKQVVILLPTDIITPIYELYDPAKPGEATMTTGNEFSLSTGDPLFARTNIPSGQVFYNFKILDLAGNLMKSNLVEVDVP
jgi:hypothetical protein